MPKGGKIGQKQSVLKRSCRKKIPKFKGVQKQKKLPVEVARNSATEITFVGEDDIVSEQIPPPAASASFRKLAVEYTESSSDESMDPKGEIPEGYRLVSINSLVEFARRIHSNSPCSSDHLELREISTSRFGLSSSLYAVCDDCGLSEFLATGDHNPSDNAPRTVQGKDLNRRVVYAAIEMGIGREDVSKFCEILNMPFSLSKDTWHSHEDALLQAHTEVVQVELEKNRREARKLAMTEEGISAGDEDTEVNIPVSFDGTCPREDLHPIYERLSDPALLSRCLPGFTQNANESINSLVWIRCPKHKWHGRKRILLATASATLQFSAGATAKHEVMARAGLAVGGHTRKESTRRDSERIKKAEKRIQDQHKKYRVARRQAKQRDEEQRRQKEGTTYSAGAFNELTVTTAPAKKRKKNRNCDL